MSQNPGFVTRLERFVRVRIKGHWVLVAVIVLSCTTNDGKKDTVSSTEVYIPVGSTTDPETDGWHLEPVAQAATFDAGMPELMMPEDPVHVSLRFPMEAPRLMVALLSGKQLPYRHQISDDGDFITLTLFIPRDEEFSIAVSPADEDGKALRDPDFFVLRPRAKLSSRDEVLNDSPLVISFQTGAETPLGMGSNVLTKSATEEILEGTDHTVMHGIFQANHDLTCRVTWTGANKLYSILNGNPECQTEPFEVQMTQGQRLGLYPVIHEDGMDASIADLQPVTIQIEETP